MKLYYSNAEEAAKHWRGATITEIFDNSHEEYCRKILENSEYISVGSKYFCELTHEIGKVTIQLYKDADSTFYDYCEYQVLRKTQLLCRF